ncbi:MAG: LptF/LptG family permease [Alphaproteobacteria bacterium]|nr:LptF/LptG family permease [Alphaproteobacteria bacterium]
MRTPWILSRYFATRFLIWFGIVTLAVCCIIFLFDFSEMARRASGRAGITLSFLLKTTFCKMPSLVEKLLPFIALFSTMITLWTLNRRHELEVARASGISIWQMLTPLGACALVLASLDLFFLNPFGAKMMLEFERLDSLYLSARQGGLAISDTGLWTKETDGRLQTIYHVRTLSAQNKTLHQISLTKTNDQDQFVTRLDARYAQFNGEKLHLFDVWISTTFAPPTHHDEIWVHTSFSFDSLLESGVNPKSVSFWELPYFISLLEKSGLSPLKYKLHRHNLLARVLWTVVMVMLAAACSLRPLRQGGTFLLAASGLVVAFLLYFAGDISNTLGASGKLPLILAAWGPVCMSGLAGLSVLLYSEDG